MFQQGAAPDYNTRIPGTSTKPRSLGYILVGVIALDEAGQGNERKAWKHESVAIPALSIGKATLKSVQFVPLHPTLFRHPLSSVQTKNIIPKNDDVRCEGCRNLQRYLQKLPQLKGCHLSSFHTQLHLQDTTSSDSSAKSAQLTRALATPDSCWLGAASRISSSS